MRFLNNEGEFLEIELNPEKGQIIMDRQNSGKTNFSETFADKPHDMPYYSKDKSADLRIVLDRASIELFVDGGRYVMTEKFFPNAPFNVMQLSSTRGTTINQLKIKSVANTWKNE